MGFFRRVGNLETAVLNPFEQEFQHGLMFAFLYKLLDYFAHLDFPFS